MLAELNTKDACSTQNKDKYDDIPPYKKEDLVKIKNFQKKPNWDAIYLPNFTIIRIINPKQLEVSDPTGRLWKVNVSDAHKILPSDFTISSILDEQVFGRRAKYINGTCILKKYQL